MYFQHQLPIDPSQIARLRERIGETDYEFMPGLTVNAWLAINSSSVLMAWKIP